MLVAILIVVNIPIYLLVAWLVFDTKDRAVDTFYETAVALLQIILLPPIIRFLFGMDDDGAWGLFPVAGFFIACAGIVYGEYWLLINHVL
ncbi:MAG: hypothetical protein U1E05_12150 [Patescibacteria group bacterium]|nr:hypothetical protein [Patescibacteria group bacterium]